MAGRYGDRNGRGGSRAVFPRTLPREHTASTRRVIGPGSVSTPHGSRECPSCHSTVPLKVDGSLRSHRVGSDRSNSWPCPGDEAAPRC